MITTTDPTTAQDGAVARLRPACEGANIRTWVGFKHFVYLVEEAVREWFRQRGLAPSRLYHTHGLGLSLIDCSVQLPAVLDVDDTVEAEVSGGPRTFRVRLRAQRPGTPTVLRGTVAVALLREPDAPGSAPAPPAVAGAVAGGVTATGPAGRRDIVVGAGVDPVAALAPAGSSALVWRWRVPYYYCQYSRRLQFSGQVRAMEEVVDRFLAGRGLSVRTMLDRRGWIPVVSRARLRLLADVSMEETVYTVFTVTDVVKQVMFDATMECYAPRARRLVHVATGRILHAYAVASGPEAGSLARLDEQTVTALCRPAGDLVTSQGARP